MILTLDIIILVIDSNIYISGTTDGHKRRNLVQGIFVYGTDSMSIAGGQL